VNVKPVVKAVYVLFGALFLVVGLGVLLADSGLLPGVREVALRVAHGDLNTLHIIQEYGAILVFAGLITLWFARRYELSRPFHWAMTASWALHALAHWFDVRGARSLAGPLVNTVPFALFLTLGLLRRSRQ
jgi:hypothetical protein